MITPMPLPKSLQKYVDEFDGAARDWGWALDQGNPEDLEECRARYLQARVRLEAMIGRLRVKARGAQSGGG